MMPLANRAPEPTEGFARWALALLGLGTGLAFLLPFHFLPWRSFQQELAIWIGWAPWMLLGAAALGKRAWPALLLTLLPACWPLDPDIYRADRALASLYLGSAGLVFVVARHGREIELKAAARALELALLVAAFLNALIQLRQFVGLEAWGLWTLEAPAGGRAPGNLGQVNHLAALQMLALVALWRMRVQARLGRLATTLVGLTLLLGLALTQSRAGALALLLVLGVQFCRVGEDRLGPRVLAVALGAYVASVVAVRGLAAVLEGPALSDRVVALSSIETRAIHWTNLLHAVAQHPWTGWGWGRVSAAQWWAVQDGLAGFEFIDYAHNHLLDLLLWCGLPLGGGFAVAMGLTLRRALARRLGASGKGETTPGTMLLAMLPFALLEYPLAYAYFLLPLSFYLGRIWPAAPAAEDARGRGRTTRSLGLGLFAGLALLGGRIAFEVPAMAADYLDMRYRAGGLQAPARPAREAPRLLDAWHAQITQAMASLDAPTAAPDADQLDAMRRSALRFPNPSALRAWADAAERAGQSQEAARVRWGLCKLHGQDVCVQLGTRRAPEAAADAATIRP